MSFLYPAYGTHMPSRVLIEKVIEAILTFTGRCRSMIYAGQRGPENLVSYRGEHFPQTASRSG